MMMIVNIGTFIAFSLLASIVGSAGTGMDCWGGKDVATAMADPSVDIALLRQDVALSDEDWAGIDTPFVLRRNFTILGTLERPVTLDLGFVRGKVRLGNNTFLIMRNTVVENFRAGSFIQASGFDLMTPLPAGEQAVLWLDGGAFIFRACFPLAIALESLNKTVSSRPTAFFPGSNKWALPEPLRPGCINSTAARALDRCYVYGGRYIDIAVPCTDLGPNDTPFRNGYLLHFTNVLGLCASVYSDECIATYGRVGCVRFTLKVPPSPPSPPRLPPAPPPAPGNGTNGANGSGNSAGPLRSWLPPPPPPPGGVTAGGSSAPGQGGGGGGRGRLLGIALGCGLGGLFLCGVAALALSLRHAPWAPRLLPARGKSLRSRDDHAAGSNDDTDGRGVASVTVQIDADTAVRTPSEPAKEARCAAQPGKAMRCAPDGSGRNGGVDSDSRLFQSRDADPGFGVLPDAGAPSADLPAGQLAAAAAPSPNSHTAAAAGAAADGSESGGGDHHSPAPARARPRGHQGPAAAPFEPHPSQLLVSPLTPQRGDVQLREDLQLQACWSASAAPPLTSSQPRPANGPNGAPHAPKRAPREVRNGSDPKRSSGDEGEGDGGLQQPWVQGLGDGAAVTQPLSGAEDGAEAQAGSSTELEREHDGDGGDVVTLLPTVLGKGAFGRVYEGLYRGQKVAVKVILTDDASGEGAFGRLAPMPQEPPPQPPHQPLPQPFPPPQPPPLPPLAPPVPANVAPQFLAAPAVDEAAASEDVPSQEQQLRQPSEGNPAVPAAGVVEGGAVAAAPAAANTEADDGAHGAAGAKQPGDEGAGGRQPSERQLKLFASEVAVLGRCDHPNVVRLLAACLTPPRLCLVMERCETSLERMIYGGDMGQERGGEVAGGRIPLHKLLHIGIQICQGLEYLHPTIVHRDLKPANVLINGADSEQPVVKLADFGLSRISAVTMPTCHPDAGTPAYTAPECYDVGNKVVTHHADMYSLGVLLWAMLTGQWPWKNTAIAAVVYKVAVLGERPPLYHLSDARCPRKLRRLIQQCWDADPRRRPAAAEAVKELHVLYLELVASRQRSQRELVGGRNGSAGDSTHAGGSVSPDLPMQRAQGSPPPPAKQSPPRTGKPGILPGGARSEELAAAGAASEDATPADGSPGQAGPRQAQRWVSQPPLPPRPAQQPYIGSSHGSDGGTDNGLLPYDGILPFRLPYTGDGRGGGGQVRSSRRRHSASSISISEGELSEERDGLVLELEQ